MIRHSGDKRGDYVVWDVEEPNDQYRVDLESETDGAREVRVARMAAEQAAEMMWAANDYFSRISTTVLDLKTGRWWNIDVNVATEPTFASCTPTQSYDSGVTKTKLCVACGTTSGMADRCADCSLLVR